jgi:hypothetical protein
MAAAAWATWISKEIHSRQNTERPPLGGLFAFCGVAITSFAWLNPRAQPPRSSASDTRKRRRRRCWERSSARRSISWSTWGLWAASRRPGFSKRQLAAGLDERGVGYLHLQKLGTPKEGRLAARAGKLDALFRIYQAHLKTPEAREAMDELTTLVKSRKRVCIPCYEREVHDCHRQWIAEEIGKRLGVRAEHLVALQGD